MGVWGGCGVWGEGEEGGRGLCRVGPVTPAAQSQLTRIHTLKPAVLDHVWIPVQAGDIQSRSHRANPTFPREVFLILTCKCIRGT